MKVITVTEASRNFSEFINRVHYKGESALLLKGGRPMVKVTPARLARTGDELAAAWPSLPHLDPTEAEAYGHDLESARTALPAVASKWD